MIVKLRLEDAEEREKGRRSASEGQCKGELLGPCPLREIDGVPGLSSHFITVCFQPPN